LDAIQIRMKRCFDLFFSIVGIIILSPVFIVIAIVIALESKGGVIYRQTRVGRNNKDFNLFKFRTMFVDSDKKGLLTVGKKDARITKAGYILRQTKLDELPQLFNVVKGDMSLIGPRPEVRKYVNLYTPEQLRVLTVRPGLSDLASLEYINENELLAQSETPEELYISTIMPAKLKLNLEYIQKQSFIFDLQLIFKTILKIIF